MERKSRAEGAIYEKNGELSITIGDRKFTAKKIENKVAEKYPDWKGEGIAVWDRVSKMKKSPFKYLQLDSKEKFVAFRPFGMGENLPDWEIIKSRPQTETDQ